MIRSTIEIMKLSTFLVMSAAVTLFPPLPEAERDLSWPANTISAHAIVSQSYNHSIHLLRLDNADPVQLRQHASILINDAIPLLQALANDDQNPLPIDWLKKCAKELGKIVSELLVAAQRSLVQYVIEFNF